MEYHEKISFHKRNSLFKIHMLFTVFCNLPIFFLVWFDAVRRRVRTISRVPATHEVLLLPGLREQHLFKVHKFFHSILQTYFLVASPL